MQPNAAYFSILLAFSLLASTFPRNIATPPADDPPSLPGPSIKPRTPIFPIGQSLPIFIQGLHGLGLGAPITLPHQTTTTFVTIHKTITFTSTIHAKASPTFPTLSSDTVEIISTEMIPFTLSLESIATPSTSNAPDGVLTSVDPWGMSGVRLV
ncbi:hypothetical protein BGZ60DRAFT_525403 [Tricladium varicosporioides]|nr:hypothetical protein BGZ60DRAFT_525403 [Hymenoscyphus varicosporioides]